MFWTKKKRFFSHAEEKHIMQSIKQAELASSGEIRVFVESYCGDSVEKRTIEVFKKLKMWHTKERNAVLIYIAMESRQFAIFGDEGIHKTMGFQFWTAEVALLKSFFEQNHIVEGVCKVAINIGETLKKHFPYPEDDKNELPDDIVYGK